MSASEATGLAIHCHVLEAGPMPEVMKILEERRSEGACDRYQAFFEHFLFFSIKNRIPGEVLGKMITDNPAHFQDI